MYYISWSNAIHHLLLWAIACSLHALYHFLRFLKVIVQYQTVRALSAKHCFSLLQMADFVTHFHFLTPSLHSNDIELRLPSYEMYSRTNWFSSSIENGSFNPQYKNHYCFTCFPINRQHKRSTSNIHRLEYCFCQGTSILVSNPK